MFSLLRGWFERAQFAGTPVLHIATPNPGGQDVPTAWFADRSGRSIEADGRSTQRIGRRYRVSFSTREGTGSTRPKTLLRSFTLTARAYATGGRRGAPTC